MIGTENAIKGCTGFCANVPDTEFWPRPNNRCPKHPRRYSGLGVCLLMSQTCESSHGDPARIGDSFRATLALRKARC